MTPREDVIAIIPVPSFPTGSDLPVRPLLARAMLEQTIRQAQAARSINQIVVLTADPVAEVAARDLGASVVPWSSSDCRTSLEDLFPHVSAWVKAQEGEEPGLVICLPPDAPLRRPDHLDGAIAQVRDHGLDRLVSVWAGDDRPVWNCDGGQPTPIQQARLLRENGAIYIGRPSRLRQAGTQPVRVGVYEMDLPSSSGSDSPERLSLVEWLLRFPGHTPARDFPARIALVVFDFDGVMTENGLWVDQDGKESVRCDRSDGLGIAALNAMGVPMMVLSTETNPVVARRCQKLRLTCEQGVSDKAARLREILLDRNIDPADVAYIGNDTNDLSCLRMVGFPILVADAHPDVMGYGRLVLTRPGGRGAVREFCDLFVERFREGRINVLRPSA